MCERESVFADVDPVPDFDACNNCGADSSVCWWDDVDGWCCPKCGASDADG